MKRVIFLFTFVFVFNSSTEASNSISKAQAMFIYNFARMVQWPGINAGDFVIGIYDKSGLTTELKDYLKDKRIYGQDVVIKEINDLQNAQECHILFIPIQKSKEMENIVHTLNSSPVLIISEKQNLTEQGAAISFKLESNRLKYQLNTDNLVSRNLVYSKTLQEMSIN